MSLAGEMRASSGSGAIHTAIRNQNQIQGCAAKTIASKGIVQKSKTLLQAQKTPFERARLQMGNSNAQMNAGLSETSFSYLNQAGEMLNSLQTLALRASDGLANSADREAFSLEAQTIQSELGEILGEANFNGNSILQGETFTAEVDGSVSYTDGDASAITSALAGIDLSTQAGAQSAIDQIKIAQSNLVVEQVKIGNNAARLQNASDLSLAKAVNVENAMSTSNAINMINAISSMSNSQVQSSAIYSVSKRMNEDAKSVLKLFN